MASDDEKKLIEMFNKDKSLKEFKDVIGQGEEASLYYAKPVTANKESCLRCHSDPEVAPKELRKMYGDVKGFHEKIGEIRAILSIKIPLKTELDYAQQYYYKLLIIVFIALLLVYVMLISLLLRLDRNNAKLLKISRIDQLTKALNRRVFDEDIELAIAQAKREYKPLSLVMLDIDYFKKINDTLGHPIGDEVLIRVAQIIQETLREYDMVYRVGGEEFMVILKGLGAPESVALAERIREAVEKFYKDDKQVTVSLGVCQYVDGDTLTSLFKRVDDALYMAKENGRNMVYACTQTN